ncbi:MAG: hypothetical protein JNM93_11445 [Bacteriovoracaceae bacterium]|nr:hypothetical protein [Bacteriovoracaceae bacterium]
MLFKMFIALFWLALYHLAWGCDEHLDRHYQETPMRERYIGEEKHNFKPTYYVQAKNSKYKIFFKNGKLHNAQGHLMCPHLSSSGIFFMEKDGSIYFRPMLNWWNQIHLLFSPRRWHHSSFTNGSPGSSMGYARIYQGHILNYDSMSGHYRPGIEINLQFLDQILFKNGKLPETITFLVKQFTGPDLKLHRYFLDIHLRQVHTTQAYQIKTEYYSRENAFLAKSFFHIEFNEMKYAERQNIYKQFEIQNEAENLDLRVRSILQKYQITVE